MACNFKHSPNGLHTLLTNLFAVHSVSELAQVITTDVMRLIPGVTQPWVFAGFASALSKSKGDRERPCSLRCRQENAKFPPTPGRLVTPMTLTDEFLHPCLRGLHYISQLSPTHDNSCVRTSAALSNRMNHALINSRRALSALKNQLIVR